MKYLGEEVAYLRGLAEGLEIESATKEGKMICKIIDVLENMADTLDDMQEDYDELVEYVETVDEDLSDVEEILYEEDDDDFDDDDDYDDDEDGLSYIEMECPNCGDLVDIDEELLFDDSVDVICPNCQATILSSDDDEGCCGCECDCEDDKCKE
ncbi:MAG: zinc ribbon domain-containing protein [Terrisporobacter sp.]|uniref:CD1247 N-terminal domain-containing protein n=1 Tax=Terrisporobacter sp. TaxID=1965305 RepID=UPI002FC663D8